MGGTIRASRVVAGQTGTGSVSGPALTAWNGVWRRPIARLGCVTAPDNRTVRLDTVQTNSRRPSWTVGDHSPGSVGATSATPCHPPIRWEPARPVPATGTPATPVCRGTRWGRQYGSVVGGGGVAGRVCCGRRWGDSTGLSWDAVGRQEVVGCHGANSAGSGRKLFHGRGVPSGRSGGAARGAPSPTPPPPERRPEPPHLAAAQTSASR